MRIEGEHSESESLVINYLHSSNFIGSLRGQALILDI